MTPHLRETLPWIILLIIILLILAFLAWTGYDHWSDVT